MSEARRLYKREWAQKNKERLKLKKQEWLKNNTESRKQTTAKYREKVKPLQEQKRRENYEWYIWNSLRSRSKRRGLEFNLEVSDIVIPEYCPYLKQPITRLVGEGRSDWNPSVDRVDPNKGYVKGNIEVMSDKANRMKNNASAEELVLFAKEVLKRYEIS